MNIVRLDALDLAIAAILVLLLAAASMRMHLNIAGQLLIAGVRTVVQLLLVGMVLKVVFEYGDLAWVALIALAMLSIAGREVRARQGRPFSGSWGFGLGTASMFVSTFSITIFMLAVVVSTTPWYAPQYAVPLLGMMLGNTMSGVALAIDRLTQLAVQQRGVIEARLTLGESWRTAIGDIRRESARAGLIPIINAMAVAGVVSLPGMMTGQILAGVPPLDAVYYQILIMFMIAAGTGFGTLAAIAIGSRRLFDRRERLRLDRLNPVPGP